MHSLPRNENPKTGDIPYETSAGTARPADIQDALA